MSRPKLGAYIRNIDYLGAKESGEYDSDKGEEDPGNKLIDYERQCNFDEYFNFDELKDGYAAFRDKVCIPNFTGRHSPPYWVAYSTACVLERLTSDFDDEDKQLPIGKELVYTWLALFCAKPTSGQLDLMSKFTGDPYEKYIETCKDDELATMMKKMKIKFSYDAAKETDEEQTYASFLHSHANELFNCLTEEQCGKPAIQEAVLDVRIFYLQQISKLSPDMARNIGYLVRDMVDKFPDRKQPYTNFTNVKAIRSHLNVIEESLCTYEGDVKDLRDEETLQEIAEAARKGPLLKELFPDLMVLVTKFSKRKTPLKNGDRIYDVFRMRLFRDIVKDLQPDGSMFDACVTMVSSVLTDGSALDKAKQGMVEEGMTECVLKCKNLKPPQVKTLFQLFVTMVKTGRRRMANTVKSMVDAKEYKKVFDWKNLVEETKQLLGAIGTLTRDQLESTDSRGCDEVIRELGYVLKLVLEMLKKAKILGQIQNELVTLIFNCLEIGHPHKDELADDASDSKYLVFTYQDKDLVDSILDKMDKLLMRTDMQWTNYSASAVQNLLEAVVKGYKENGKNVTDSQNAKFLSIFATCCEGETLEDKFVDPEDENLMPVYKRVYMLGSMTYISLHAQSQTLSRCVPLVKDVLKWGRLAFEEDHSDIMTISFGALNLVSLDLSPELADITPEIVDLFLSVDMVSDLTHILRSLYPLNPEAVHQKLVEILDLLGGLNQSDKQCVLVILFEVAGKHPEKITKAMVEKMIDQAVGQDQGFQVMAFNIISTVASKCPQNVVSQFSKLQNDGKYHVMTLLFRVMTIVRVACHDNKLAKKATEYIVNRLKTADLTTQQHLLGQAILLARNEHESMVDYKRDFEKLEASTSAPEIKELCRNILNAIEGKSIEGVFEDIQQAQEDISDLDKKVGATMNTVITLGDRVIEQDKDITNVRKDVDKLDERVDVVEDDLTDTKGKVEEIDNKTMTNAPKWSRDLTKLMNPTGKSDWRLLAQRLGYSNDDIRGWAQQNDPCMALLSEWYATHKTSEATHGLLTHLQEMNRPECVAIVENAMKATEDVVEDEEFEYPVPPPVFLSYQWGVQSEVKLLKQHLNMAGYECWMDIGQMGGGDKLFNKIDSGIRAAKVVICCTTEKYAQSPNCNREVNLSVNLGKPIIPLLMEKMSWPPKGSMGPIFSEYLFIRFFQRNGEETNDQRYWPVAKFQELLMQINFHTVPDQSLIQPVYSNWWSPIVEDIKIKKETTKGDSAKKPSDNKSGAKEGNIEVSPVIFLSYQWGKQPQVKVLYERLVALGYTVWMDIFQMGGGDSLYDKIDRGMRGCKVVVSCVTTKYSLSANCRREVSLADAIKKPMIPLLFEPMKWPPDGPMSMVFTELLYINVHRDQQIQETWTGEKFEELKEKLRQYVPTDGHVPKLDSSDKTNTNPKETQEAKSTNPKESTDQQTKEESGKQNRGPQYVVNQSVNYNDKSLSKPEAAKQETKKDEREKQKREKQKDIISETTSNKQPSKSKSCSIL